MRSVARPRRRWSSLSKASAFAIHARMVLSHRTCSCNNSSTTRSHSSLSYFHPIWEIFWQEREVVERGCTAVVVERKRGETSSSWEAFFSGVDRTAGPCRGLSTRIPSPFSCSFVCIGKACPADTSSSSPRVRAAGTRFSVEEEAISTRDLVLLEEGANDVLSVPVG